MDLTELDNWLGTLEELKLGLDSNKAPPTHRNPTAHVNRTFLHNSVNPVRHGPYPRGHLEHLNPLSTELPSPVHSSSAVSDSGCPSHSDHGLGKLNGGNHSASGHERAGCSTKPAQLSKERTFKGEVSECGLNTLLRDLEAVEERMRKLEQGSDTFTRRYSLASSPTPCQTVGNPVSSKPFPICTTATTQSPMEAKANTQNGYVSAEWAAELNRDSSYDPTGSGHRPTVHCIATVTNEPFTSPPAWLGAGDACVSPSNSPQPNTPSLKLLEQTDAGLWCLNHSQKEPITVSEEERCAAGVSGTHFSDVSTAGIRSHVPVPVSEMPGSKMSTDLERKNHQNGFSTDIHPKNRPLPQPTHNILPGEHTCGPLTGRTHGPIQLNRQEAVANHNHIQDDDSSLSGTSTSWSPGPNFAKRDMIKSNSLACPRSTLSNSLSPESSLSEKSLPDPLEAEHSVHYSRNALESSTVKKLIIRIFRPDKTTKAILIDESMTAGEVASILIEKNFLQPSIKLALVEKVPALKVERIFEEHENVAACILAWSTSSQNMLFFEERDHYGFIESPALWFGEEKADKLHKTTKAIQAMLRDIEQTGFPEWRDHLYVCKPRDKTWARRLCVLRSSGLYTSKKNKLPLSSTDLKRIVPLDGQLQLYTTTGGWTRSHAPTPHGFALKPYSVQDSLSNVFCFCATDEKAFRQWICHIRMAKYGKQLYLNYQQARNRVEKLELLRHATCGSLSGMNGSASAGLHRKSSFDMRPSSSNSVPGNATGSVRNLSAGVAYSVSPTVNKRPVGLRSNSQRTIISDLPQF